MEKRFIFLKSSTRTANVAFFYKHVNVSLFTGMYYLSRDVSTAAVLLTSSRFTRTVNRVAQLHVVRCFVDSIKQKKAIESFTGGRKEERQLSNTRKLLMDTKLEVTYFWLR